MKVEELNRRVILLESIVDIFIRLSVDNMPPYQQEIVGDLMKEWDKAESNLNAEFENGE